jgi:hypothetical protein
MGRHIINALLGLIGGFFGVLLCGVYYEYVWGGGYVGTWILRKSFYWLSDFFIIVPALGGIIGGAATDNWWGPVGGGFFVSVLGFYLFVFLLGVGF